MIACLHTHASNIAVFEAAARALGLPRGALQHTVREDLLAAVEHEGALTPALHEQIALTLHTLANQAQAVLLTCSSLGPVVEAMAPCAVPVVRADAALAAAAVRGGRRVIVLCAAPTTLTPTHQLFERAAQGAVVEVRLVDGAWALFKSADLAGYFACLRDAVARVRCEGDVVVAMAQASMAPAVAQLADRPLTSPDASLEAVLALTGYRYS